MSDTKTDIRQNEASDDRLLRFFVATEKLLQAADVVRQASQSLVADNGQPKTATRSEVRHDA